MKLYNVVVVFDVYAVGESPEDATRAILEAIYTPSDQIDNMLAGDLKTPEGSPLHPSSHYASQVVREWSVREAWKNQKPYVGAEVSDEDFEKLKGKTTIEAFKMLHVKEPETTETTNKKGPKK